MASKNRLLGSGKEEVEEEIESPRTFIAQKRYHERYPNGLMITDKDTLDAIDGDPDGGWSKEKVTKLDIFGEEVAPEIEVPKSTRKK